MEANHPDAALVFRRYLRGLLLLGIIVSAIIFYQLTLPLGDGTLPDPNPVHSDFLNYWAAPQIATLRPQGLYDYTAYMAQLRTLYAPDITPHVWSYPLHALFFFAPFSHFSPNVAFLVWVVCGLACFLGCVHWAAPARSRSVLVFSLLCAPITFVEVVYGQNGFFIGAGALAVLVLLHRNHPVAAGIVLGCLTMKPHLFLLWPIMLLCKRAWKTIAVAIVTTVLLVGASFLIYGADAWRGYLEIVPKLHLSFLTIKDEEFRYGPYKYHAMMLSSMIPLGLLHINLNILFILQAIISLVVLVVATLALRATHRWQDDALILASGGLLLTPYAFNYDLTFFTAALLLTWIETPPRSVRERWLGGAAYLLPVLVFKCNGLGIPVATFVLGLVFVYAVKPFLLPASPAPRLP